MNILNVMENRHSVRRYTDKVIEPEKRDVLNQLVSEINEANHLHIQIFYDEPTCFDGMIAHYGNFIGVRNYICLVGPKGRANDEVLGYFGEKVVLKATELGLNTCWVALNHGKSKAVIQRGEKQICLIALGYGEYQGGPHRTKTIAEVSNATENSPKWFVEGVKASLLAPTAVNQQKYFITLAEDGTVQFKAAPGIYTRLDLGIAKYHFDVVSSLYR